MQQNDRNREGTAGVPSLSCPVCLKPLAQNQATVACPACGGQWLVRDGIPNFLENGTHDEYEMAGQTRELNEIARSEGWRAAAVVAARQTADPAYYLEYITSEARADFRFLLPLDADDIVLDIGSGWGNMTVAFARTCRHVFAVDTARDSLDFVRIRARQEGLDNVTVVQAGAGEMPLPAGSCDVALMVGVLEWVAWGKNGASPQNVQERVLRRVWNTLAPGGCLYVGIENRLSFKYFLGKREPHTGLRFVSLLPMPVANLYSRLARNVDYREVTYSKRGLAGILKRVGFDRVQFYYPVPGYQNFRFLANYGTRGTTQFVFSHLRAHPKFTSAHYAAARLSLLLGIHKWTAPCFSVVAYKGR